MPDQQCDVLGVSLQTYTVRVMARDLSPEDAEAYAMMAVMRRGVEVEFFAKARSGRYKDGDSWPVAEDA